MTDGATRAPDGSGAGPREHVVHLASEYWPFARSGGLGEAVRGIAHHQEMAGFRTAVVLPLYRGVRARFPAVRPASDPFEVALGSATHTARLHRLEDDDGPATWFVECDPLFDRDGLYGDEGGEFGDNDLRFGFFCRAVLEKLRDLSPEPPLLHAHDWHTSLAPVLLRTQLDDDPWRRRVPVVLTVHNAGYQGWFDLGLPGRLGLPSSLVTSGALEHDGRTNLLKGGLVCADMVTTVSPTHAHELRTRMGAFGLHGPFADLQDRLVGILNGIDYAVWDPATDPALPARFSADDLSGKAACKAALQRRVGLAEEPDTPLFAMTARLAEQKGFDILLPSGVVGAEGAQWVFLGEGEARYREALQHLAHAHPGRVAATFRFSEEAEHRLLAAADYLVMPSLYEPCGLTQMRAQRYGALPVVRRVGGLADTVEDRVTGFLFDEYEPWAFAEAVGYARELYEDREGWREHAREAMERDFSWEASVLQYQAVYGRARRVRMEAATG